MTNREPYQTFVYRNSPSDFISTLEVSACYCQCNEKFLLLKRAIGKPQENTWGVPAGKLEKNETPYEAVFRETFEEVGIHLDEKKLQGVGKLFVRYPHLDFVYHMFFQKFSDLPDVSLSDEHQDYCWVTFDQALEMPLISGAKEALLQFQTFLR